jgi:hypothetical protein
MKRFERDFKGKLFQKFSLNRKSGLRRFKKTLKSFLENPSNFSLSVAPDAPASRLDAPCKGEPRKNQKISTVTQKTGKLNN